MRKFTRAFVFILAFQLEVRVKAEVVTLPDTCKDKTSCVYSTYASSEKLDLSCGRAVLAPGAMVLSSMNFCEVVKGDVLAGGEKEPVHFLQGRVYSKGLFWMTVGAGRVRVRALNSRLKVILKDGSEYVLGPGFEVWIGRLDGFNKFEHGASQALTFVEYEALFHETFVGVSGEFKHLNDKLKKSWSRNIEIAATQYKNSIERQIASEREEKRVIAETKKRVAAERAQIKRQYFERVFER